MHLISPESLIDTSRDKFLKNPNHITNENKLEMDASAKVGLTGQFIKMGKCSQLAM